MVPFESEEISAPRVCCCVTCPCATKSDGLALRAHVGRLVLKVLATLEEPKLTNRRTLHRLGYGRFEAVRSKGSMSAMGVRREKAALSSGCKPRPATAPAGSNRSRHGGDEMSEAFG